METRRRGLPALSLEEFILFMSRKTPSDLTHSQLVDMVERLSLSDELIAAHTRFARDEYARNLVCRTPGFELLVLCWRPGHHSTIHDHGGSLNVIKVQRGELTSRIYDPAEGVPPQAAGPVRLIGEQRVRPGSELAGVDRRGIHQLANTSSADLVTVHIYAPPLMHLVVYTEDGPGTELRPLRYTLDEDIR